MTFRWKTLLAALLLICGQVHAGVLYAWQYQAGATARPLAGASGLPHGMLLEIEFSDAAVAAGSVDFVIDNCGWAEFCAPDPEAPVTRFLFAGVTPPIDYAPAMRPMDPFAMLRVSVRFEADGYLSGTIAANDTASSLRLGSGAGTLFTVEGVSSDFPDGGGCDLWSDDCRGATGYLRSAQVQPVPEPGSMLLFAIAMIGLLIAGRRR